MSSQEADIIVRLGLAGAGHLTPRLHGWHAEAFAMDALKCSLRVSHHTTPRVTRATLDGLMMRCIVLVCGSTCVRKGSFGKRT